VKYIDEYRDRDKTRQLADAIAACARTPHTIMEICGGQTHSIVRFGIDRLLPKHLTLVHGPGCPVCVTPVAMIDKALAATEHSGVVLCSFGDMLRVPGSHGDLLSARARGADVRTVYSPLDAVSVAEQNPERQVVFFAVGFETTAPANALAVLQAEQRGLENFSILSAQVLVPPAMEAILSAPECRVEGFLAAGHVCAVVGYEGYERLAAQYRIPIVVTGFEPVDLLQGVLQCVRQLEEGRCDVENAYARAVRREGNETAQRVVARVFEVAEQDWRGLGSLPESGLRLRPEYAQFDAEKRLGLGHIEAAEDSRCISGQILRGLEKPPDCPAFGIACTPERPLGAPMVSSEGACAAYFRYRRVAEVGG